MLPTPLPLLIMAPSFRIAALALLLTPFAGHAQPSGIGLEVPAPAAPSKGRFLAGAYAAGGYLPLAAPAAYGYGVQPYLRYQLGTSATGRPRPFVQYTFAPYRLPAYGAGAPYGPEGGALPANAGFAPLALRNGPYNPNYNGYNGYGGGTGTLSVGVPVRIGSGSAVLSVGGSVGSSLTRGLLR
ncbi:hypothetical protein BEN49_02100 [Hymenobacter coccineus]|uniref:Uncharacterized protein n=2 Tax=Hymenobacter coccineus TaxID=1908235 RepID=A0A1G1SY93_9BACT|nr:hypothetical protein BEN49_02100 [Hymenobacter coccineus]